MNDTPIQPNSLSPASNQWLTEVEKLSPQLNFNLLISALQLIEAYQEDEIPLADSPASQGLVMAEALLELNCDSQTIAAALLYPSFYHHKLKRDMINRKLNHNISKLLQGAARMETINDFRRSGTAGKGEQQKTDNLRKMLLGMVDDVRVVLIKLAERLAILKYLKHCPKSQQQLIAEQTMSIYAPLANRLGIGQLKWQLEDLSFRYINPEQYASLSKALNMRRVDREHYIVTMIDRLKNLLDNAKIKNIEISGRAKHIYSIYKKIQRKHTDISEIYDTSALRILVPTINDCYSALSIIHSTWEHIAKEFDDYIAKPKPNGYRSIHTAVVGPQNINVEIQVRTHKMHEEAELGVAAHWKYKEGKQTQASYEDKINWLREVIDWQKEMTAEEEDKDNLYSKVFEDRVYVFSPNGDVYDLRASATPLDFAYHVHTEVGHRCRGAKVNGQLVTLTHHLKTGDQVHIITAKTGQPSRDWLNPQRNYLNTPHAISKVRHWFKKEAYQNNLAEGQIMWEKAARRAGLNKAVLNKVISHFNFKKIDDLIAAIGAGDLGLTNVIHYLKEQDRTPQEAPIEQTIIKPSTVKPSTSPLEIAGVDNLLTQLAKCCKPIPGDAILGYITQGRGITIHQKDCYNIKSASDNRPERIIAVNWGGGN